MIEAIKLIFKISITVVYVGILLLCIVYVAYIFVPIIILSFVAGAAYLVFSKDSPQ